MIFTHTLCEHDNNQHYRRMALSHPPSPRSSKDIDVKGILLEVCVCVWLSERERASGRKVT